MSIDERFSRFLFERTKNSVLLTKLAIFCGSFLIWLMIGFAIGYDVHTRSKVYVAGIPLIIVMVLVPWLITFLISHFVKRPRPFESEHYKPILKLFVYTNSFPSAHTTIAFALLSFFLFLDTPNLFVAMLICAVLVGLGRIAVGVHYVSDVIVGALIGFLGSAGLVGGFVAFALSSAFK